MLRAALNIAVALACLGFALWLSALGGCAALPATPPPEDGRAPAGCARDVHWIDHCPEAT